MPREFTTVHGVTPCTCKKCESKGLVCAAATFDQVVVACESPEAAKKMQWSVVCKCGKTPALRNEGLDALTRRWVGLFS